MNNAEIAEIIDHPEKYLQLNLKSRPSLIRGNPDFVGGTLKFTPDFIFALKTAATDERKIAAHELVPLPKAETSEYDGLKVKYRVFKADDNTAVEGCFVLRPDIDPAARFALMAYALGTSNHQLSEDIMKWLLDIQGASGKKG